jgi:transcription elongation factor GreA
MVNTPAAGDTMTVMLLQENNSIRVIHSQAVPVTSAARAALERDLASLHAEQREIPARLRVAREFGDTANNDEHQAIREEEAVLTARIARLEDILLRVAVIERDDADDAVTIGCGVNVFDVDTEEELEYVIGSAHGVLARGTVSALSPVGQALLGRRVGERVSIQLPHGRQRNFELRQVRRPPEP